MEEEYKNNKVEIIIKSIKQGRYNGWFTLPIEIVKKPINGIERNKYVLLISPLGNEVVLLDIDVLDSMFGD